MVSKKQLSLEKPVKECRTSRPRKSKRQKSAARIPDQSIEQLNDVTAVSGIDMMEEQYQLSGPKQDLIKPSRRTVQPDDKEALILQRTPLLWKLKRISYSSFTFLQQFLLVSECDIKSMSKDVERCLSLSLDERMHRLIINLIRVSRQRVDFEKTRHQTIVTSNVQHQIVSLSRKGRDRVKQQAEEGATAIGDKDEDAPISERSQAEKVIRVQQTAAANVAARAAIGGEDVASKWRHMSRKAQSVPQSGKGPLGAENISPAIQFARPQHQAVHLISVQDVIAVLEREPQMSKSKFMHCLHERSNAKAVVV